MKRFVSSLLTVAILAGTFAGLCACKEEDAGEPFLGVASEQTFETAEKAAEAFFKEEVCGENENIVFVKYEKKSELSESEISALALSEADRAQLVSAERGEVVYYDASEKEETASLAAGASSKEEYRQKLFLLYMRSNCKYYVPPVEIGERLTKSYYLSLFDIEKYTNCTMTVTLSQEKDAKIELVNKYMYKFDGEKLALYMSKCESMDTKLENYIFPYQDTFCRISNGHGDYFPDIEDTNVKFHAYTSELSPQEYFSFDLFKLASIDYSRVVKIEKGFELAEEYSRKDVTYKSIAGEIKNNKIISFSVEQLIDEIYEFGNAVFTDFGTTKIEVPAEVQKLYDEFVKEQEEKK